MLWFEIDKDEHHARITSLNSQRLKDVSAKPPLEYQEYYSSERNTEHLQFVEFVFVLSDFTSPKISEVVLNNTSGVIYVWL